MPAVDLTPPALPAGAPVKHPSAPAKSGQANHVSALSADGVAKLRQHGLKVLDNREGLWRIEATLNGRDRVLTVVDGVLPSGREVVGFGTAPASTTTGSTSLLRALDVSANTTYFFICSYAVMAAGWDQMYLHLCTVDAAFLSGILLVVGAAVGGLVGALMGGTAGAVVGIAITTLLSLAIILWFWSHSDSWGNIDLLIPNLTMQPPFGGNVYWSNVGLWDYMYDQCWINERGNWYAPVCSY
jgi:hypothetical protein